MTGVDTVSTINILILDDNPEREATYRQLEKGGDIKVDFRNLKDQDTTTVVKGLRGIDHPDIIFLDHILDKTLPESAGFMRTGMCVSPILRDMWPRSPIVAVTAAKDNCIQHDGNSAYEEVFDFKDISQLDDFVRPLAQGYQAIGKMISETSDGADRLAANFVGLLSAPEEEVESILHSIPDELRALEGASFAHAMYRWFRRILHAHPGFLYNKEWVAVTIGVNKDFFDQYAAHVERARYKGVWADPNQPRWWKKILYEIAIKNRVSARESVPSAACQLFDVDKTHYSMALRRFMWK